MRNMRMVPLMNARRGVISISTGTKSTARSIRTTTQQQSPFRRVVVTGLGGITPLGSTLQESWNTLLTLSTSNNNNVGITTLEEAIYQQNLPSTIQEHDLELSKILPCQVAAPVRNVDYDPRTSRFAQFAIRAGEEALQHAGLTSWLGLSNNDDNDTNENDNDNDPELESRRCRIGASIGTGMSGARETIQAHQAITNSKSIKRLAPHFVPKVIPNAAVSRLSMEFKLKGPSLSQTTACAAGTHAIGDAMRCIQFGDADVMLAGGAEASIDPVSMGGFCRLRALSTNFNHDPKASSRPFDSKRDGFVMGEGAAVLVLEELEHAQARGAPILCELRGYGLSSDAYHITSPDPNGAGAERAMRMALERAGIEGSSVNYVNAHATSTPMGDGIEESVIDRVLRSGEDTGAYSFVSSTKGATGHLLGAAGAVESAITVMSLLNNIVPPSCNTTIDPSKEANLCFQHVTGKCQRGEVINVAVKNSFGFGGTNASIVFTKM